MNLNVIIKAMSTIKAVFTVRFIDTTININGSRSFHFFVEQNTLKCRRFH